MKDWLGLIKKSIYSHTNIRAKGNEKLSATPVAGSSYPTGLRVVLDTRALLAKPPSISHLHSLHAFSAGESEGGSASRVDTRLFSVI